MQRLIFVVLILLVMGIPISYAQDDSTLPAPERVELTTTDGLVLVGDYYRASEESAPSVILMHMYESNRRAWEPLLPVLVNDYGFHVLNVDLRGHGESRGTRDWVLAQADTTLWVEWLRQQPTTSTVALVGASIGSNLAIRQWSSDPEIATVVALSPGLDFWDVTTADAVEAAANRPIMLIAARNDRESAEAINTLYDLTEGYATVRMYTGSLHGTSLFRTATIRDYLVQAIAAWISENTVS